MGEWTEHPLPANATLLLHQYAPQSRDLNALSQLPFPESQEAPSAPSPEARMAVVAGTLPPGAPEWMQAARALSRELEALVARGQADEFQQAAIARAWSAWALVGSTRRQILRVAHVASRAHTAIRETSREGVEQAAHDAAGVVHAGLPSPLRQNLPFERVLHVVRQLRQEADHWSAVVDAVSELLGWRDYARLHAAAMVRLVIERGVE